MDIQVYALTIDRELREEERCYLTEVMPFSRRQRMLRLREQKQSQPLCAYGLLRLALQRLHGFDQIPSIAIAPAGKPYLSEEGKICFNISHTDGAVLCAVHGSFGRCGSTERRWPSAGAAASPPWPTGTRRWSGPSPHTLCQSSTVSMPPWPLARRRWDMIFMWLQLTNC